MAAPAWLTLCWNGKPVGRITEIETVDWPWMGGRFKSGRWPKGLRAAVEWLARQANSDGDLEDPPFSEDMLDGWTVVDPDDASREISPPAIDFEAGTIEWR